jgi:hypothetical protein
LSGAPETSLTSTSKPFLWNDKATKAFNELKQVLQSDIVLHYPDYSQPFVVQTDASDVGIGEVLLQHNQPILFYSRKLSDAKVNYAVYDKELLAIVSAFSHYWRLWCSRQLGKSYYYYLLRILLHNLEHLASQHSPSRSQPLICLQPSMIFPRF